MSAGRKTRNVVPTSNSLATSMNPPCVLTIPNAVESPNPVPLPISLVVKKGSKILLMISGEMPCPVSATVTTTCGPVFWRLARCRAHFHVSSLNQ